MLRELRPSLGRCVLDVGCGAGGMTALLNEALLSAHGFVCALDVDASLLEATRAAVTQKDPNSRASFCLGDIESLPFAEGAFDLVWCSRVVHHHLPDPAWALAELRRVLKPEGHLALREIGPRRLSFSTTGLDAKVVDRFQDGLDLRFKRKFKSRPDDKAWVGLLQNAGFSHVEVRVFGLSPPAPGEQADFLVHWLEDVLEDHQGEWGPLLADGDADLLKELLESGEELRRQLAEGNLGLHHDSVVYLGSNKAS